MFQRVFRQTILSSNKFIVDFPCTFNIKCFSTSSMHCKKSSDLFTLRPASPFSIYLKVKYPKMKEEHPNFAVTEITQAIAAEWKQLSTTEKAKYKDLFNEEMKEYRADDAIQEIEKMKQEIKKLLHDKPTQFRSSSSLYFTDRLSNSIGNGHILHLDFMTG